MKPRINRRRQILASRAAPVVGPIEKGCEIYGLTMGECSLAEIVAHIFDTVGPAKVLIGCWTCAVPDIEFFADLLKTGRATEVNWILDNSIGNRKEECCELLEELFGEDHVFATSIHAKFIVIQDGDWNLAIRSSMNLNLNRRIEYFEISDSEDVCRAFTDFFELVRTAGVSIADAEASRAVAEDVFWKLGGRPKMRKAQLGFGVGHKGITYGAG